MPPRKYTPGDRVSGVDLLLNPPIKFTFHGAGPVPSWSIEGTMTATFHVLYRKDTGQVVEIREVKKYTPGARVSVYEDMLRWDAMHPWMRLVSTGQPVILAAPHPKGLASWYNPKLFPRARRKPK